MTSLRKIELRPGEEAVEGATRRKEKEKWEVRMEDVKLRHVPRRDARRDRRMRAFLV
jgi:hypothetical protein